MLLHIPPLTTLHGAIENTSGDGDKLHVVSGAEDQGTLELETNPSEELGALIFNPALGSASGLLRGLVQPRWEYASTSHADVPSGRPGLWFNGHRVRSWTPEQNLP